MIMKRYIAVALLCLVGCRSTYYAVWEKLGREKRDLLRARVTDARDEQKQASKEFKSALDRMKELYGFEGGKLESAYNRFKGEYEDCADRAEKVRSRIQDVETVGGDLFKEWDSEIRQISDASMRADSRRKLDGSRTKYDALHASMKRAEASMDPILTKFRDNVLYLKHNLNAQAIGALKGESVKIESDISGLIADMNKSIAEAEAFIKTLD
jgi:predicted  nucleic acid-binding Zn-ribbon protein